MEKDAARQERQRRRAAALNATSCVFSVASVAFCVLLSINAADLRTRLVDVESLTGEHKLIRAPGYSSEDLNSLIEEKVNELLSQVTMLHVLHASRASVRMIVNEKCLFAHFSAPSRVTSRSGPRDRRHLSATVPQVKLRAHAVVCWSE